MIDTLSHSDNVPSILITQSGKVFDQVKDVLVLKVAFIPRCIYHPASYVLMLLIPRFSSGYLSWKNAVELTLPRNGSGCVCVALPWASGVVRLSSIDACVVVFSK